MLQTPSARAPDCPECGEARTQQLFSTFASLTALGSVPAAQGWCVAGESEFCCLPQGDGCCGLN